MVVVLNVPVYLVIVVGLIACLVFVVDSLVALPDCHYR